jgi:haloacetate dehalogenase
MSTSDSDHSQSPSGLARRDLLRSAAALAATGAVLSASRPAAAQTASDADARFFPGFRTEKVKTSGSEIHAVIAGSGPPVLLLHGAPQSRVSWHAVARDLARDHAPSPRSRSR